MKICICSMIPSALRKPGLFEYDSLPEHFFAVVVSQNVFIEVKTRYSNERG